MVKITNKKMYRDLMAMDGARMRDLNPASKAHYAASVVGPVVATGAKVVGIAILACAVGMGAAACKPDQCDCTVKAHLGVNEDCCAVPDCTCTEQTATVGGITIKKDAGITVAEMNAAVAIINLGYADFLEAGNTLIPGKITAIRVVSSDEMNFDGRVLLVPKGVTKYGDVAGAMIFMNNLAQLQPQTKNYNRVRFGGEMLAEIKFGIFHHEPTRTSRTCYSISSS